MVQQAIVRQSLAGHHQQAVLFGMQFDTKRFAIRQSKAAQHGLLLYLFAAAA
ncbi:hypothetical protein D3C75_1015490 [compost metagenome]